MKNKFTICFVFLHILNYKQCVVQVCIWFLGFLRFCVIFYMYVCALRLTYMPDEDYQYLPSC